MAPETGLLALEPTQGTALRSSDTTQSFQGSCPTGNGLFSGSQLASVQLCPLPHRMVCVLGPLLVPAVIGHVPRETASESGRQRVSVGVLSGMTP